MVGVLVLGAGAAIGVPKLVSGGSNSKTAKKPAPARHTAVKPALRPSDITVAVLNGTHVNGAATQLGDRLQSQGFNLGTTSNAAQQQQANSVVMYSSGHEREARFVAGKLHLSAVEPADSASRGIAGDAAVIVIVGSDLAH